MSTKLSDQSCFKVTLLTLLSKPEYHDLVLMIGDQVNDHSEKLTSNFLRNKLNLTKKECNSRVAILMNYDLVDMINDQYTLTTLGNDVYESLRLMGNAIKMREKFDMNDKNLLMLFPSCTDIIFS